MKGSPMKVKVGSVVSREEVLEGLAIRRGLEKAASRSRTFSNVFKGMSLPKMFAAGAALSAGAATAGAGSMGVSTAIGKGQEALHKSKRDKHFSDMLKADPSLKTSPKAKAFFNVLHQASPFIATEPHVAAATVRSMIEAPEGYALHPKFMKDVLDIEEKRQKTRYPGLRAPTLRGEMPDLD